MEQTIKFVPIGSSNQVGEYLVAHSLPVISHAEFMDPTLEGYDINSYIEWEIARICTGQIEFVQFLEKWWFCGCTMAIIVKERSVF